MVKKERLSNVEESESTLNHNDKNTSSVAVLVTVEKIFRRSHGLEWPLDPIQVLTWVDYLSSSGIAIWMLITGQL
jgi:hypothetical protein